MVAGGRRVKRGENIRIFFFVGDGNCVRVRGVVSFGWWRGSLV